MRPRDVRNPVLRLIHPPQLRFTAAMPVPASNDPLHGVTLETIVTRLVAHYGWSELGQRIDIRCFNFDPSVKSSLQFLRRTPWARTKVEQLYVRSNLTADIEKPEAT